MITYEQSYKEYKRWCEEVWGCAAPSFEDWMHNREGAAPKPDKAKDFLSSGAPDSRLTTHDEVEV